MQMPSLKGLAFLGCRLLSLAVLCWMLGTLALSASLVGQAFSIDQSIESESSFHFVFWPVLFTLLELAMVLFLWVKADWISGWMTQEAPNGEKEADWSQATLLSMAVALVGFVLLITTIPQAARSFYLIVFEGVRDSPFMVWNLLEVGLTIAFGIGCLFGRKGIADFIAKARGR